MQDIYIISSDLIKSGKAILTLHLIFLTKKQVKNI